MFLSIKVLLQSFNIPSTPACIFCNCHENTLSVRTDKQGCHEQMCTNVHGLRGIDHFRRPVPICRGAIFWLELEARSELLQPLLLQVHLYVVALQVDVVAIVSVRCQ